VSNNNSESRSISNETLHDEKLDKDPERLERAFEIICRIYGHVDKHYSAKAGPPDNLNRIIEAATDVFYDDGP
jgi:hypothetical protein